MIVTLMAMVIFLGPFAVKIYLNHNGEKLIGRQLKISGLYHNPFNGYTRVREFKILEQNDTSTFASFDTLIVDLDLHRLFSNTLAISEVSLINPFVKIIHEGDRFNFSDIPEHFSNESEPEVEPGDSSDMIIEIRNISLINGASHLLLDQPLYLEHITLQVPDLYFDSRNTAADLDFDFHAGGSLASSNTYNAEEGTFEIEILIEDISIEPGKILQQYSNITRQEGLLNADINVNGNLKSISEMQIQGTISLSDYQIYDQNNTACLSGDQVKVIIGPTTPLQSKINLELIEITNPVVMTELFADSTNNFTRLAKASDEPTSTESDSSSQTTTEITITELRLTGGEINIKDHKTYQIFDYGFTDLELNSSNISSDCTAIIKAHAKLPDGGSLDATYEGNLFSDQGQAYSVTMNISDLTAFSPYTITLFDYPIEEGQMGITNTTHVVDGYMAGVFILEGSKVKFGKHAETESIYKIPLKVAMWALEDKDGNVFMELPVGGQYKRFWHQIYQHCNGYFLPTDNSSCQHTF